MVSVLFYSPLPSDNLADTPRARTHYNKHRRRRRGSEQRRQMPTCAAPIIFVSSLSNTLYSHSGHALPSRDHRLCTEPTAAGRAGRYEAAEVTQRRRVVAFGTLVFLSDAKTPARARTRKLYVGTRDGRSAAGRVRRPRTSSAAADKRAGPTTNGKGAPGILVSCRTVPRPWLWESKATAECQRSFWGRAKNTTGRTGQ